MLGLVNNQVVELVPVCSTGDGFTVEVGPPSTKGIGKIYTKYDGRLVDVGIRYHRISGDEIAIEATTGRYRIEKGFKSTVRVVIGDQHRDVEVVG